MTEKEAMKIVRLTEEEAIKIDRYLKIVMWAQRRYSVNGCLPIRYQNRPTIYSRIEDLAAERYIAPIATFREKVGC